MEGSPQRKKARFSQHPQVFQYSSQNKKENQTDNDSLLLDNNDEDVRQQKVPQIEENHELDSNAQRQLQIQELTSGLAQIEAYLQQESKPLEQLREQTPLTPNKNGRTGSSEPSQRFSINLRPELRSGRETMTIQQQIKVRSTAKQLPQEISNNKRRAMQQNKQKSIEKRIQNEIKKNKRVTMDVKELLSMINQTGNQQEERKFRDQRKNRITLDVFALSKLIEDAQQDNQNGNQNNNITPLKNNDKEIRKSKVFSAFKDNAHSAQIKLFVNNYINQAAKRLQQKQAQNKKLVELISHLKSQMVKVDLKIVDAKKKVEKRNLEKEQVEKKIRLMKQELGKMKYMEDIKFIEQFQTQHQMRILKCDMSESGCYAHIIFDGIFLKIKSKSKYGSTDIKFLISNEVAKNQKYFYIPAENAVKLIRKYHAKFQQRNENFIQNIVKIRKAYKTIQKLDYNLHYLSLNFQLKNFQLNTGLDKLSFQLCVGEEKSFLMELNVITLLDNEHQCKAISVYDPTKPGYLSLEIENKQSSCVLFDKVKKMLQIGAI